MLVSVLDRAGNESGVYCSPYTEIDVYAPSVQLQDSTSIAGYARDRTVSIDISNNYSPEPSEGAYWCITSDPSFTPPDYAGTGSLGDVISGPSDLIPCTSGQGDPADKGWLTTPPTEIVLPDQDGAHEICLWIVRGDGTLVSNKQTCYALYLDRNPPADFAILGVHGGTDVDVDEWFTSDTLVVDWEKSIDLLDPLDPTSHAHQVDYTLSVFDQGTGNLVCQNEGVIGDPVPGGPEEVRHEMADCSGLIDGMSYRLEILAFDEARNETLNSNAPFVFTVDRTPPGDFSITGVQGWPDEIADGYLGDSLPEVIFTESSDAADYTITIEALTGEAICGPHTVNNTPPVTSFLFGTDSSSCVTGALTHGRELRVRMISFDAAKNYIEALNSPYFFTVDLEAPDLSIHSHPDPLTADTSATFVFSATDPLSGVSHFECSLDGAVFAACTPPVALSALPEGERNFRVRAFDHAGNMSQEEFDWTIDITNPVLTLISVPADYVNTTSQSISFEATDLHGIDRYECSLNSGPWSVCASPHNFTAIIGSNHIAVRAHNPLDNFDEQSTSFLVDTEPPTVGITSGPGETTHNETSFTFSFSHSDTGGSEVALIECRLNSGSWTECTSPHTLSAPPGAHLFEVRVADGAGNQALASHSWTSHTYSWQTGAWSACSANPMWSAWSTCSSMCGTGQQTRTCSGTSGTQTRSVTCRRDEGATASEASLCQTAKPSESQSCTAFCSGSSTQTCNDTSGC